MKILIVILSLCTLVLSYADINDKVSFDQLFKQPEILKEQLLCYLDRGPCSPIALTHKGHILDAVMTACAKCTPTHKHNVKVFIQATKILFPELNMEFRKKYDPDGKHYDIIAHEVLKY